MDKIEEFIEERFLAERDIRYREFSASLLPGINNIFGIRLPVLRKLSRELVKKEYKSFLSKNCRYMEGTMLQGMLIGLMNDNTEVILSYVNDFLPKIDNWSVCDSFCCSLKFAKKNPELVWRYIEPLIFSSDEYKIRFALVMILDYYINEKYIDKVLELVPKIKHDGYYAKMAAAWVLSMCFIKFPDKVYRLLRNSGLDNDIKRKTIKKICESYRVSNDLKKKVKTQIE